MLDYFQFAYASYFKNFKANPGHIPILLFWEARLIFWKLWFENLNLIIGHLL